MKLILTLGMLGLSACAADTEASRNLRAYCNDDAACIMANRDAAFANLPSTKAWDTFGQFSQIADHEFNVVPIERRILYGPCTTAQGDGVIVYHPC